MRWRPARRHRIGGGLWTSPGRTRFRSPLGNFTVHRYARVEVSAGVVQMLYVLDLAEIPAFQVGEEADETPDAFAVDQAEDIAPQLDLVVDREQVPLTLMDQVLEQPPGQSGLKSLRLTALYAAEVNGASPEAVRTLTFTDGNEPDRFGWREIVVTAAGDAEILDSDAPAESVSDDLRDYPYDRISSPLDPHRAMASYTEGSIRADPPSLDGSGEILRGAEGFAALVTRTDLSPPALGAGHGGCSRAGSCRLGLALLAAFSVGLAATLTVVGLGLVYGRSLIERRGYARWLRFAPVVGATALILLDVVVTVRAVVDLA